MTQPPFTLTLSYDIQVERFDQAREVGRQLAAQLDELPTKIGEGAAVRHKLADFRVTRKGALRP